MTTWHTVSLFLHLIAFAMWIGAMVFFLIVMGPAVQELEPGIAIRTMNRGRIGLESISWIAIGLLFATGVANLALRQPIGAAPGTAYMIMLGAKLFIFLAMTVHHCLQVFKYAPRIAQQSAAINVAADGLARNTARRLAPLVHAAQTQRRPRPGGGAARFGLS